MFNAYYKWLGIPQTEQPPNNYRLLGISLFESDPDVIDAAANRQMGYIQGFANSEHSVLSQRILNELADARLCLLDTQRKSEYDEALRIKLRQVESNFRPPNQASTNIGAPRQVSLGKPTTTGDLDMLMSRAKEAHAQSRWDLVIETTSQVIKKDPRRAGAYLLRAEALRKQNLGNRALADLAVAIRLDPLSPHPYVIRAWIFKKQGHFDQAVAEATQAIFLDSNSAPSYAIRCECRRLIGDHEGSRQDAAELFRLDPTKKLTILSPDVQESRKFNPEAQEQSRLATAGTWFEDGSDLLADGESVDRSLNLPNPVSANEVAEALIDASHSRSDEMPRPMPTYRSDRTRERPTGDIHEVKRQMDIFADGDNPADMTYRSRSAVSNEDDPEALGVISGYSTETTAKPLPRIRKRRRRKPMLPIAVGLALIGLFVVGYVLINQKQNPQETKPPTLDQWPDESTTLGKTRLEPPATTPIKNVTSAVPTVLASRTPTTLSPPSLDDESSSLPKPILALTFDDDCEDDKDKTWDNAGARFVEGRVGKGVEFDGSAFMRVSGSFPESTKPRTLAVWLKGNRGPVDHNVHIVTWGPHEPTRPFGIMEAGGKWRFFDWSGELGTELTVDEAWHHHAVSYDGTLIRYFFDGKAVAETSRSLTTIGQPLILGTAFPGDTHGFVGRMDELMIYDVALNGEQVKAIMENGRHGKPVGNIAAVQPGASEQTGSRLQDFEATYRFDELEGVGSLKKSGRYRLRQGIGIEFLPGRLGQPCSSAETVRRFTYPLAVEFLVSCKADGVHDIWPALFGPLGYCWGTNYNTKSHVWIGREAFEIPHQKIVPNRIYRILFEVDPDRNFTVSVDGLQRFRRRVPDGLRLEGPIIMQGGIGHVIYKRAHIKAKIIVD